MAANDRHMMTALGKQTRDIGTADAAGGHVQKHVVCADNRLSNILKPQGFWRMHDHGLHRRVS